MKKKIGVLTIYIFCLIPFLLWLPSIQTGGVSLRSVSQVSGLVGVTLLSINFIMAGRYKFLEGFFNGLNKMFIIHHLTGIIALILLLFHPMLIALFYLKLSLEAAFSIIFPPLLSGFATWFGMAALLTLVILLILTLYIKLPYQLWKLSHKFMGLALIFATIHVLFISSTVSTNVPLRLYILTFCLAGILVYLHRTILGRLLVKRYDYVVDVVKIVDGVTAVVMSPTGKKMSYFPGQFIFVKFTSLGITSEEHPFSLTSIPEEKTLTIAAKSSGDYTETLKLLKVGSQAQIEGPFGRFSYTESPRTKQVWIAGGIGITPFVSMAKSFRENNGYQAYLYYVVKESKEAIFLNLLQEFSRKAHNLTIVPFYTKSGGHLTAEVIAKDLPDYLERDVFVCGPPPMMKSLRAQFTKSGLANHHIHTEQFSLD